MIGTRIVGTAILIFPLCAPAQTTGQLQYVCKSFVERSLNDPRDADLSGWTKATVSKGKDGLYTVHFRGRAKNAYGALMLATFECVVRHTGGDNFSAVRVRAL
jgi:hypothetical protein